MSNYSNDFNLKNSSTYGAHGAAKYTNFFEKIAGEVLQFFMTKPKYEVNPVLIYTL